MVDSDVNGLCLREGF